MLKRAKLVLTGESGVGKSSIITRFYRDEEPHTSTTIGGALYRQRLNRINLITKKDDLIDIEIWDTAGQERFRSMSAFYFRNCTYCFLVFDLNDRNSFIKVDEWRKICGLARPDNKVTYFLIGNKMDIGQREVSMSAILKYCQDHQISRYLETSAKEGVGIKELQEALKDHMWANFDTLPTENINVLAPMPIPSDENTSLCSC